MKSLIKSLLLLLIAVVLSVVLLPVGIVWTIGEICVRVFSGAGKKSSATNKSLGYLASIIRSIAIGLDQIGNSVCRDLLNRALITSDGYKFGKVNETISSVLGKNQRDDTLTIVGLVLVILLDALDPNHCKNSIQF